MQTFDWALVRSFLAVVETGSLSAAARRLGSSQPTVGRQIAELEAQIGVVLFQRTGRAYVANDAALDLLEQAVSMQDAAAAFSRAAAGQSQTVEGTVRVTASEVVATYLLPQLLAPLMEAEPALEIEVVASNSTENLMLREADIAVRMVEPQQADLIAQRLGSVGMGIFAHNSYIARRGLPETVEDLRHHVFLGYDTSDLMLRGIRNFGVEVTRHDFRFRTDSHVAYLEAIRQGVGLGASMVRVLEADPEIVRIFPDTAIPPLPMWLAAHQDLKFSVKVRRVYDHLAVGLRGMCDDAV